MTEVDPDDGHSRRILGSVGAAFSSWWAILGIFASSLAGFSLARRIFQIELVDLLAEIVRLYQSIYLPFVWLADAFNWPRPASWVIDTLAIWLLIGGIVLRSAWVLRASATRDARRKWKIEKTVVKQRKSRSGPHLDQMIARINKERLTSRSGALADSPMWNYLVGVPSALFSFVLCGILFWPAYVLWLTEKPFVHINWDREQPDSYVYAVQLPLVIPPDEETGPSRFDFKYDLRVVLAMQAFAAVVCTVAWLGLQAILELYT